MAFSVRARSLVGVGVLAGCMALSSGCGSGDDDGDDDDDTPYARSDGAVRLTFPIGRESNQNACVSPDGTFLVFTRFDDGYNDGPAHIYRLDLHEGAEPVQLTDGDYDDVNVPWGCFNRSTGRVVFASDREDANDFWSVLPDPDAPDLVRETDHGEFPIWIEPVYSSDGDWIAFESDADISSEEGQRAQIRKVEPSTGDEVTLVNPDGEFDDRLPSWSLDGRDILYQHRDPAAVDSLEHWEALIIPADGGSPTNVSASIVRDAAGPDTDLSWMPDGRFILSSANHEGIPHPNIFLLPVAGGPMIRVTFDARREDGAPCASPDGTRIVFESHRDADEDSPSDLWMIDTPSEALSR